MNRSEHHPSTVLLDKLRAGLLDDDAEEKTLLQAHLQHCAHCQALYTWPTAAHKSLPGLDDQLERIRQQAMSTPRAGRSRRLIPVAAAAALALVAVAMVNLLPGPENGDAQIATYSEEVPELYEELDFYLWLSDHKPSGDSST